MLASPHPHWTSQICYEAVAFLLSTPAVYAVLIGLVSITAEYYGPLEAAHARIDDDGYDLVEFGGAGQPTLDLSDQLRGCSISSTPTSRLRSANELVWYHLRLKLPTRSGSCPY